MIIPISPEQTYPLRRAVLRKNMPNEPHEFKGDFDDSAFHLGYFSNHEIVGVVTVLIVDNAAQIRGMAVDENFQGKGIGAQLVREAEILIEQKQVSRIWMNARATAVSFYEKLGYSILGECFEIEPIGPHYVMQKNIHS